MSVSPWASEMDYDYYSYPRVDASFHSVWMCVVRVTWKSLCVCANPSWKTLKRITRGWRPDWRSYRVAACRRRKSWRPLSWSFRSSCEWCRVEDNPGHVLVWWLLSNILYPHVCQDKLDSMWLQPPGQKPFDPFDQPVADARAIQRPRGHKAVPKVWRSVCLLIQLRSPASLHPYTLKAETNKHWAALLSKSC